MTRIDPMAQLRDELVEIVTKELAPGGHTITGLNFLKDKVEAYASSRIDFANSADTARLSLKALLITEVFPPIDREICRLANQPARRLQ